MDCFCTVGTSVYSVITSWTDVRLVGHGLE